MVEYRKMHLRDPDLNYLASPVAISMRTIARMKELRRRIPSRRLVAQDSRAGVASNGDGPF